MITRLDKTNNNLKLPKTVAAFTTIELLVVIAVIAALAAITVIAYVGITNQAHKVALSSGLSESVKALENYKTTNGITSSETYPTKLSDMTNLKLDNSIAWTYTTTPNYNEYCLQGTTNGTTQSVSSTNSTVVDKPCGTLDGLVGWWKLNGNANDSSGNNNNGTIYGATATTGENGSSNGAYSFDGVGNYIETNNKFLITLNNGSVSFWCYTNGRGSSTGNNQEDKVSVNYTPLIYGTKSIAIYWSGASSTEYPASVPLPDLMWTHVTVEWGNAGSGNNNGYINVYLGGDLKQSITGLTLPVNNNYDNLFMGMYRGSSPYNGILDDVRIYNRTLSASEISALYSAGAQ